MSEVDISKMYFPGASAERLHITPESFDIAQRIEATDLATASGRGVVMDVQSSHTEFWADPEVPVGKIAVYMAKVYRGMTQYVTTLDSPDTDWSPWPSGGSS